MSLIQAVHRTLQPIVRLVAPSGVPGGPPAPDARFYLNPREFARFVDDMPKVELHTHVEGLVRPETMMDIAQEEKLPLPAADLGTLKKKIGMGPGETLLDFLKKFDCYRYVFDTRPDLERIAYEAIQDNAKENVLYTELRMDPLKHPDKVSIGDTIDSVLRGMKRGAKDFGVDARFIVSINRRYSVESAMEVAKAAVARKGEGVVGLDLAGDEQHYPASLFKDVFAYAKANGLKVTIHAGEACGPDSIRQAIQDCGADRIGHGVRLLEDPDLEQEVKDKGITLELCPYSNVELNVVKDMKQYPLVHYLCRGLKACLSTDDKGILGTTLRAQFMAMAQETGASLGQLQQVVLFGADASFADAATRDAVRSRITQKFAAMNEALARKHPGATPENTYVSPDDVDHWMASAA